MCWRVRFDVMDNAIGLLGLALVVVAVAVWRAQIRITGTVVDLSRPEPLG